jgi:Ca2+-binding EF-hand superfamily protein
VRVSLETKRDFLAACKIAGRSASDVIREGIDDFIDQRRRPQVVLEEKSQAKALVLIPKAMRRKRYVAAGAAAFGLSLLAALPSAAAPDLAAAFRKLDADGDGVLTGAEFGNRESLGVKEMGLRIPRRTPPEPKVDSPDARIFLIPAPTDGAAPLDLMRDVRLQGFGIPPASPDRVSASFSAFDADKNGAVDIEEFLARQRLMLTHGFETLDKNGDGSLDSSEYAGLGSSFILYPRDAILELGVSAKYGPLVSPATLETTFDQLDTNDDGKLSLQEYLPQS